MHLYMVHCGFYDSKVGNGLFEGHTNIFVCAADFEEARAKAKSHPEFKRLKMHIDGLIEIQAVDGCHIQVKEDRALAGETRLRSLKYGSRTERSFKIPADGDDHQPGIG